MEDTGKTENRSFLHENHQRISTLKKTFFSQCLSFRFPVYFVLQNLTSVAFRIDEWKLI